MYFPVSGVHVCPLIPFLAALGISFFTSMGGVSGSFLLLPFQVSVLGFISPAVTPTNHLFNVIAIPSGVYRYIREGRMIWPLTLIILVGTIPGVILGTGLRIQFLLQPERFKLFIGCVLLILGTRLAKKIFSHPDALPHEPPGNPSFCTLIHHFGWRQLVYAFGNQVYRVSTVALFVLSAIVGIVGGAYGIGGGAFIAPFLVSFFRLPVHSIAAATLSGTCLTSFVGVLFFTLAQPLLGRPGIAPDWMLGGLFGLGGVIGMYAGARFQKKMPARAIEVMLAMVVLGLASYYIFGFIRSQD